VETPSGLAHVHLQPAPGARGALVLGHGAGGSVSAPDLVAVTRVALDEGFSVALVEQPYRVAGKKSPPRAPVLDAAWTTVVERLREDELRGLPLVAGGRSSGARVACRTAGGLGAAGVLCLAFPLIPPAGESKTRLPELEAVTVPLLIVQGSSDRFGMPPAAPGREVVEVAGDHGLKKDLAAVAGAARAWLRAFS
jgi:uncharacterized protein